MDDNKLKAGILGLSGQGCQLLEGMWQTELFDIIAIASQDSDQTKKIARKYEAAAFDDYRQLVVQNALDVLIVADPMHLCEEYVRAAMKKAFNVVKLCPPCLDFEQAAEFITLARKEKVMFTTVPAGRFSTGFGKLKEYLESEEAGPINLINATCYVPPKTDNPDQRWLSAPESAGGGVLLRNCYELIDQIVLNFGVPEKVYSLNTNMAPDKQQRLSITEDTAVVTMKFSDTLICNLLASRTFGPDEQVIRLYGKNRNLAVSAEKFTICDSPGEVLKRSRHVGDKGQAAIKMFENLGKAIRSPETKLLWPDGNAILNNMAVIESAYLSAKTGMPEEPSRILGMIDAESTGIWSSTMKRIV